MAVNTYRADTLDENKLCREARLIIDRVQRRNREHEQEDDEYYPGSNAGDGDIPA